MTDERLDQIYLEVVGPKGGPLSRAYGRAVLAAQPQPEVPVPAPPFDPAVEPPWHRSDMGPAQPEAKDDVAYCQWCDRPVSEHAVIGKCEFVKGRKLPQPEAPLTDEEIKTIWWHAESQLRNDSPDEWWLKFARAVLAAQARGTK